MYKRFQIATALPESEVMARVAALIGTPRPRPPFWPRHAQPQQSQTALRPFLGLVSGNAFRLQRARRWERLFDMPPVVRGLAIPSPPDSRVIVTVSLPPLLVGCLLFWTAVAGALVWPLKAALGIWPPIAAVALAYLLALSAFIPEAREARHLLEEALLRGEPLGSGRV